MRKTDIIYDLDSRAKRLVLELVRAKLDGESTQDLIKRRRVAVGKIHEDFAEFKNLYKDKVYEEDFIRRSEEYLEKIFGEILLVL